jgi:hypothetical protein
MHKGLRIHTKAPRVHKDFEGKHNTVSRGLLKATNNRKRAHGPAKAPPALRRDDQPK